MLRESLFPIPIHPPAQETKAIAMQVVQDRKCTGGAMDLFGNDLHLELPNETLLLSLARKSLPCKHPW